MRDYSYVKDFQGLGMGMFVHFGLYSVLGKGEWYREIYRVDNEEYAKLFPRFKVKKNWAKELVKTAKLAGAKYITLTTRHHDGFSLYDTCGLNEFDAPHSPTGRDLVREFVDECNAQGIVPFFYHTLLDWWHPDYENDFPAYIDYLVKSVEILCKNYGKIGGLWFDGMWNKWDEDWQEDRLYGTIRKYQPEAMIINNTGLNKLGEVGHPEIDSVTFERGKPCGVESFDRPRAGEMCQVVNSHWGYAKEDCDYKSVATLLKNLVDCRSCNCNFLLNIGPMGNGSVGLMERALTGEIGKWIKRNKNFIYEAGASDIAVDNAVMLKGKDCYYAVVFDMCMASHPDVALKMEEKGDLRIPAKVKKAVWLDNGKPLTKTEDGAFQISPFAYGTCAPARVAKITLEN